jgi:uncharacterized protein (TIGR03437 family)
VFGDTVLGTSSPRRTITVSNFGGGPVTMTTFGVSDGTNYSIFYETCAANIVIAPGGSCTVSVEFHPTQAIAYGPATLSFQTNATNRPTVSTSGAGIYKKDCKDSDGDGLCDDWETNGVTVRTSDGNDHFVNLPAMGANALHKDIFIQADWMYTTDTTRPYGAHYHTPKPDAMADVVRAFAAVNIDVHIDCGRDCSMKPGATWGDLSAVTAGIPEDSTNCLIVAFPFKGGPLNDCAMYTAPVNATAKTPYIPSPDQWTKFDAMSVPFLNTGRGLVFHHAIFGHFQHNNFPAGTSSGLSGNSLNCDSSGNCDSFDLGGSKIMVTLAPFTNAVGSQHEQGGTLMHELGHNLSLHHGGNDETNYKPNYLSVMNYSFQIPGLIYNGGYLLDYSRFNLPALDETNLNEFLGLGGPADFAQYGTTWFAKNDTAAAHIIEDARGRINWDDDGFYTAAAKEDIDGDTNKAGSKIYYTLNASQDDWDHLWFCGGDMAGVGAPHTIDKAYSYCGAPRPVPALKSRAELPVDNTPAPRPDSELNFEEASRIPALRRVQVIAPNTFGLAPGTSATLAVMVANTGLNPDNYVVDVSQSPGWVDANAQFAPVTLQPGASAMVQIKVSVPPSAALGTVQRISFSAKSQTWTGIVDSAQVFLSATATPETLAFSSRVLRMAALNVGTSGMPSPLVVTNTGGAPVGIASILASDDFSQTNNCGSSLASNASCVIEVVFTPTDGGIRNGAITVTESRSNNSHVIYLQSTGVVIPLLPKVNAVVNAATSVGGSLAPGALFTIYGANLAAAPAEAGALPLPENLGGVSISVGGIPAAMLYAGPDQVNAQLPFDLKPGSAGFVLTSATGKVFEGTIQVSAVSPGLFMIPGGQHAAAQNQDLSVNSPSRPTPSGGVIVLYSTGGGVTDQTIATGAGSPFSPPANLLASVTANVGTQAAKVVFAGMTPGTAGLAQVNIVVPATGPDGQPLPPGDYPVVLTVDGVKSNAGDVSVGPAQNALPQQP